MKANNQSPAKFLLTYLTVLIALVPFMTMKAGNLANKIRSLESGTDTIRVLELLGSPSKVMQVERWIYPVNNEVVMSAGFVYDIRLNPALRDKKISFRHLRHKSGKPEIPVKYLRIGMAESEVIEIAGRPEFIEQGQDWYYTSRHRVEVSHGVVRKTELHLRSTLETVDWVRLNFSPGGLLFMNITLAFIMFGVALGIKPEHFRMLLNRPKPVLIGIFSQFFALPFLTFLLVLIIRPIPSVAMGMILVAACPGGNISNFISSIAKGNVALSITLTAFATIVAIFMTPFNFAFWGKLYSEASNLVIPISIDPVEMLKTVVILLGIPVVLGISFAYRFPVATKKIMKPFRIISMILFLGFVVAAFSSNFSYFLRYIHLIFLIVLAHNALALLTGFSISSLFKLNNADRRTITIETGIQNSGIALVLIFNPKLFDGLGGMAFIAAWWGIWHILAGLGTAWYWSHKPIAQS